MAVTRADAGIAAAPRTMAPLKHWLLQRPGVTRLAVIMLLLAIWEIAARFYLDRDFISPPSAVLMSLHCPVRYQGRTGSAVADPVRNRNRLRARDHHRRQYRPCGRTWPLCASQLHADHSSALRPAAGHDPADLRAGVRHRRGLQDRLRRQPWHVPDHDRGRRRRAENQSDPSHQRPFDGREPRPGTLCM